MTRSTVRQWLLEHTPLEPALLEGAGFAALVAERVASVARGDESAYVHALARSPDELERLTADIAVPETWLFRYPNSFELLVDALRRLRASGAARLRMCSIGCATGQEPYCMAITAVHAGWPCEQVAIDAFDRNAAALRIAAEGRYGSASIRGEIPGWAAPFLERDADAVRIDATIHAMVRFVRADVTALDFEASDTYDIVFCRNVLIYLNADARGRLLRLICKSLAQAGMVFVGHAEQLIRGETGLRPVAAPHAFALERVQSGERPIPKLMHASATAPRATEQRSLVQAPIIVPPSVAGRPEPPLEKTINDARDLADAGRMAESEAMIQSIITRRGPSAAALELLGLIRMSAHDVLGARRLFEQAVYLEPGRPASLLQLAMINEQAGDSQRAAALWARARRASMQPAPERSA